MKILLKKKTNEQEFWKYYLHIRNASLFTLTDKELVVMAGVLAGDPYKSMFKKKGLKDLCKSLNYKDTQSTWSSISITKKSLVSKGFLTETEELMGDVLVAQPLRDFQLQVKKAIKEGQPLSLELYFEIDAV